MLAMQNREGVTVESIKAIQQDWQAAETKTKMAAKVISRKDFDRLPVMQRAEYVRAGGKIFD